MPSLVPRMPFRAISVASLLLGCLLDIDVDTGRQVDAHQGVNRFRRGVEDVDQSLVRTHLEVLPRVLVLMRGPNDAVHVLLSRQRHGTNNAGAGTGDRLNDLACRGVNRLVVVGLEPDADLLSRHASPTSLLLGPLRATLSGARRAGMPPLFICLWSTDPRGRACRPYAHSAAAEIVAIEVGTGR